MAIRQYIGARYVPKFSDKNGGVWDNTYSYEALEIVKHGNDFYTAKKPVPIGVAITNTDYWIKTGDYNGAIARLQEEIDVIVDDITELSTKNDIYNVKDYGVKGDGITDDTDAINTLINTVPDGSTLFFPNGTYLVREVIDNSVSGQALSTHELYEASLGIKIVGRHNITIEGVGSGTTIKGIDPVGCLYGNIINISESTNIIIKDIRVYGNLENHVNVCNTGNMKDEWLYGIHLWKNTSNCLIDNVTFTQCHADGLNLHDDYERYQRNIHVRDCTFTYCGRNGIQCGKSDMTFISNCYFNHMTGAQTTGCAVDCEAHDYVTSNIYINNCVWEDTRQGVAFNTIKNAIVSNCKGDSLWNQSRKNYHNVPFDRGIGTIVIGSSISMMFITDGTKLCDCDSSRITIYSNLDATQENDEASIEGCTSDIVVFYGNFDGKFIINSSNINYIDIEPNFTVKGLNIIGNIIRKMILRMSGELNVTDNIIIGDYDTETHAVRTLGTGTHKFCNNIIKVGARSSIHQINLVGDKIVFTNNTIEDSRHSGTCVVATSPIIDMINNYIDASGSANAMQVVCADGILLVDGNISKAVNGLLISSGTNQTGANNRNYNI